MLSALLLALSLDDCVFKVEVSISIVFLLNWGLTLVSVVLLPLGAPMLADLKDLVGV